MVMREDGRAPDMLRSISIEKKFLKHAEGSVLIAAGDTKVICTASVEDKVPPFLKGSEKGWVTAEYSMLPRATKERTVREAAKGRPTGRTYEIQRLIGRSLRSVVDLDSLGERTIWIDCDVIQADGGTRTASITGAFVALAEALHKLYREETLIEVPLTDYLAAVSVGKVGGEIMLDLCYSEDYRAEVDMNIVMTGSGRIVEVQGTAEEHPFTRAELDMMLNYAGKGISELIVVQKEVLGKITGLIG